METDAKDISRPLLEEQYEIADQEGSILDGTKAEAEPLTEKNTDSEGGGTQPSKVIHVLHVEDVLSLWRFNFYLSSIVYSYYLNAIRRIVWNPEGHVIQILVDAIGMDDLCYPHYTDIFRDDEAVPLLKYQYLNRKQGRYVCLLTYREQDFALPRDDPKE